jgi:predicted ABC-type exoprotein transport system permease subunit
MNIDLPTVGDQDGLNDYRRSFFVHVGTVVLTAALVVPLLVGIASIPSWLSVAYCIVIAIVAFTFVLAAINNIRNNRVIRVAHRIECLVLTLALSIVQVVFVLPVLICIFAPTFRF